MNKNVKKSRKYFSYSIRLDLKVDSDDIVDFLSIVEIFVMDNNNWRPL